MVTGNRNILNSIKGITSVVKLTAAEKTALADRVLPANVLVVDSSNIIYLTDGVTAVKALNPLLASATKLQTARTINGTSFNGTANITTTNWGTARNISITDGTNTSTAVSVNGSANVSLKLPATIKANLTGNSDTATKATQDSAGQQIDATYIKGLAVSGRTITYTKGDGTTGTITTQDTNTDTKVTNTLAATTKAYVTGTTSATTNTGTQVFDTDVYLDTVAGQLVAKTFKGSLAGNASSASTATKLQTACTINGTSFNGTADITTTNWGTARDITIADSTGDNTGEAVSVNGSAAVTLKLPATIKASLDGNAATATSATTATNATNAAKLGNIASSGYVQTGKVNQTIDGTKTFSAAIVGSVTGNAATATKATGNANGKELTNTIIKGLSISGKTITYTQIDGNTGTLTTQDTVYTHPTTAGNKHIPSGGSSGQFLGWASDGTAKWVNNPNTNTDTLMTQNVSTTNATYPVLLVATADATANQGAKTGIFAKSVKVNPSTNVISASGFSGPLTGNVTGNCSGSSGSCTGNAATATQFSANATVALTGDATGTSAGSKKGWSVPVTLANSGVTAGTYGPSADVTGNNNATISVPEITVDAKGRVTSVVNRTLTCKNNTYNVYNKTLTIQKNGTNVATFTSNSNTDVTANITVPTKVSELTNDSGYLTSHQSLSNYVTLNGAQTISGIKTISTHLRFSSANTRGTAPSANEERDLIDYKDSAGNRISLFETMYYTDKSSKTSIHAYKTTAATGGDIGSIGIGCDASGNVYTYAPTPSSLDNSTKIATTAFVYNTAAKHLAAATNIYVAKVATGNGSGSNTSNYMALADLRTYLATVHMHSTTSDMNGSYNLQILFKAGDSFGNATFDATKMPGVRNLILNTSTGTNSTVNNYSTNSPTFGNITVTGDIVVTMRNLNCTGRISSQYGAQVSIDTYMGISSLSASNSGYLNVAKNMVINVCDAHIDYLFLAMNNGILAMWPGATVTINFRQQCYYTRSLFYASSNGTAWIGYSSFKLTGTEPMAVWGGSGTLTGTSETAAATVEKAVTLASGQTFTLTTNATAKVKFTVDNTANNPTLNIGRTGAKPIYWNNAPVQATMLMKNITYDVKYNGSQFVIQNAVKRLTNNDFGVFRSSGNYNQTYNSGSWNFTGWALYYGTGIENSNWRGSHIGNIQQNVSTSNDTFPVLISGTANATANTLIAPYFAKGVKINPSTNVVSASGFSGPLTGNVTGNCSGSSGSCTGNAATATQFSANATVALTGDATGTSAGSKKGWSVPVTLANSGVTAGTYGPSADVTGNNNATISVPQITVDAKGRVTSVTNRTLTCKNNTYTVNNATLTIQKNGTNVATFTSNASANATANITVPTKTSQLTNDSGFLTSHQSLSNYVTLNGAQTISGAKTLSADTLTGLGGNGYRIINGSSKVSTGYGVFQRIDSGTWYLMVTAKDDALGSWTTARPAQMTLSTGILNINGNAATATISNKTADATDANFSNITTDWIKSILQP